MKKSLFILSMLMGGVISIIAQNDAPIQLASSSIQNKDAKYLLFPTKNDFIFLKLNTRNGEVSMVQYSLEDNQLEVKIDSWRYPLVTKEQESNGRFFLYPTKNFYNFLLVDQINGRVWQVQWSFKKENRMVTRIYNDTKIWKPKDSIMIKDIEVIDHNYYLNNELFDGVAFLDKNCTVGKIYIEGREVENRYCVFHKNGTIAFRCNENQDISDCFSYSDEEENSIEWEEFKNKYPDVVQRANEVLNNLKPKAEVKKSSVTSKSVKVGKK